MDYYGDNDPGACEWIRELMAAGLVPEGVVDERPIQEIQAADLAGYRRVNLFAGIAGWVHALRLAGWPATRPVWTASCPCQPFSTAGKRKGQADERHLWPVLLGLIRECRPATVFGEQVASDDGYRWLARVRDDLEEAGYAVGC
ncbi:MAG: DNA cytosine methyltransferase, partial [Pseudomonadota bacterium]